eukprot:a846151_15.p1 GENE.a846151_15~~a846151_15.p1  ORF type:complete len:311 (-),score=86.51 a846151_15:80-973(-)
MAATAPSGLFSGESAEQAKKFRDRGLSAEDGEPRFHWQGEDVETDFTAQQLWAAGDAEASRFLRRIGRKFVAIDAHGVFEVNDRPNMACVELLRALRDRDEHDVFILSWVGFSNMETVGLKILALLVEVNLGDVPILLCTGNRIGKACFCQFGAKAFGAPALLLDDSPHNLRASFLSSNVALAQREWGVEPPTQVRFLFYYDVAQRGKYIGRPLAAHRLRRRAQDAALKWLDVCDQVADDAAASDGALFERDHFLQWTAVAVDCEVVDGDAIVDDVADDVPLVTLAGGLRLLHRPRL